MDILTDPHEAWTRLWAFDHETGEFEMCRVYLVHLRIALSSIGLTVLINKEENSLKIAAI
jgi:hypothetical protein